jgi:hypothetical protein
MFPYGNIHGCNGNVKFPCATVEEAVVPLDRGPMGICRTKRPCRWCMNAISLVPCHLHATSCTCNTTSSSSMCHVSITTYHIITMSTTYRHHVIRQQGHSCGEGVIMTIHSHMHLHPYTWSSAVEIAAPLCFIVGKALGWGHSPEKGLRQGSIQVLFLHQFIFKMSGWV